MIVNLYPEIDDKETTPRMENETREFVRTTIELPAALNEKLSAAAKRAKRSRHAQMLIALERFFETPAAATTAAASPKKEAAR